jgi:hypothetical protein
MRGKLRTRLRRVAHPDAEGPGQRVARNGAPLCDDVAPQLVGELGALLEGVKGRSQMPRPQHLRVNFFSQVFEIKNKQPKLIRVS